MSQLLVDDIVNKDDSGAVSASKGINVSGIATLGIASASQFEVAGVSTLAIASASQFEVAGVTTFSGDVFLAAGGANRISMRHTSGGDAVIKNPTAASLSFGTNDNDDELTIANSGNVAIAKELGVAGVTTVGILTAYDNMAVGSNIQLGNAGVVTATSFEGDGGGLTGLPAGFNWVDGSLF